MSNARPRAIFLFLDGVGLGPDDPAINPLAAGGYPTLAALLDGRAPVAATGRLSTAAAELIPTDARLGIAGRPQSATGQAALLTGINAPARLGEHYGPRPDARVRAVLDEGSLFQRLAAAGRRAYFCNAYPQSYFDVVNRGKRVLSAVPYAARRGGQRLPNYEDLQAGRALAADFTGEGWRSQLGYADVRTYTPAEAGQQLWRIAEEHDFIFVEHWLTDMLGHRRELAAAVENFRNFDAFLGGLLAAADLHNTLLVISSDHGNVEDCSHGKHTLNPVLTLLVGPVGRRYAPDIAALTDFAPAICDWLGVSWP